MAYIWSWWEAATILQWQGIDKRSPQRRARIAKMEAMETFQEIDTEWKFVFYTDQKPPKKKNMKPARKTGRVSTRESSRREANDRL